MRNIFFFLLLFFSCHATNKQLPEVHFKGAMRNFMINGDISAKIYLDSLKNKAHLYGLGASENLNGEIIVLDGKLYHSFINDSKISIDSSFDKKAVLFVYSQVRHWDAYKLPLIKTTKELEAFISKTATEKGFSTNQPFPFLLTQGLASLEYHILNWKNNTKPGYDVIMNTAWKDKIAKDNVEIIGFYSNSHQGIFTHHGSLLHLHFIKADKKIGGHIDEIRTLENMSLLLPK